MVVSEDGTTTFINSVTITKDLIDYPQAPIMVSCPPVAEMHNPDFACSFASVGGSASTTKVL